MFEKSHKYISTYMIPLLGILYASLPKLRGNLVPHLISIMIIGIYERFIQTGTSLQTLLVVLGHLSVLLLITTFRPLSKSYGIPVDILLLTIGLAIIKNVPVWKYKITREQLMYMYLLIVSGILINTH